MATQIFYIFTPKIGKKSNLTFIFLKWVGSTTNEFFDDTMIIGQVLGKNIGKGVMDFWNVLEHLFTLVVFFFVCVFVTT